MKKIILCCWLLSSLLATSALAQQVALVYDNSHPPAAYAARKLSETLKAEGYSLTRSRSDYDHLISLGVHAQSLEAEAFSIRPEGKVISVYGGDDRGLIYGALDLAEKLRQGARLENIQADEQKPQLAFRGIKYNVPWETYRPSSALDQHYQTARDPKYWEAFLDMMVENRFNVISLWNTHPYSFMMKPKNFPEASPWSKKEQAEWEKLYRSILGMAKERALDTYIVHWSIFVSEAFAKSHGVAKTNFYPHYYVDGDTSEIVRRYLRESVKQVLEEYPELDGVGISHGEGMAGMTPLERQKWMDDVLIAGMRDAKRPVKLIHRVPFSSGTSSDPGASKEVEQVTREAMEALGDEFDGPIWVEMKFNWSHGHSTPKLVKVHGGELGDTYFKTEPKNYKVVWMIRNEDFFALRWGVPGFIRDHIALNGRAGYVGGYFIGSETYIPALDYFTAQAKGADWTWAFERQWLFYKLWGRLLYDARTPDAVFQNEFDRRYGDQGKNLLNAYSLASSTPLRLASLYNSTWDFTLYSEGFMALQDEVTRYISVDRLIKQPTLDPDYVSVADYVETLRQGGSFAADKLTPLELSHRLTRDNQEALRLVQSVNTANSTALNNTALNYEVADVRIWANLGLHLAEKLKGAVALHSYRLDGDPTQKQAAIAHLQKALDHWDQVVQLSRPLYKDMPLVHYNHGSHDANPDNLFHWALIRDQVAEDVEIAKTAQH